MMRLADMTPESPCLRLADGYEQCGLLWQHAGPCVPFTPGDYLPPPILHPLDVAVRSMLRSWLCLLCGTQFTSVIAEYVTAFRGEQVNWDRPSFETRLTFLPCGCVGRDVEQDSTNGCGQTVRSVTGEALPWWSFRCDRATSATSCETRFMPNRPLMISER